MILPEILHKHLVYPLWTLKDGNYPFRYLKEFEQNQYADPELLDSLRWRRMRDLLAYAYENTHFYRRIWKRVGIHPDDVKSWQDLLHLPLVEKQDIQRHLDDMISGRYERSQLVRNQTGGSTGQPLVFYHNRERMASRLASTIRHDRWAGKDFSTSYACLWGHPDEASAGLSSYWASWKQRHISRMFILDSGSFSLEKFDRFAKLLMREQPPVYLAYANSIYLYARFLLESGTKEYHRPLSIITSAEVLTLEMREVIEDAFGCKVFNRYGCRETSVIASECGEHSGLHVNADCLHVEILRQGQICEPGQMGEVVVTDLLNFGMPLIRYRIRDVASRVAGNCECGRTLPLIDISGGRATDFISTPEGRMVSGPSLAVPLVANAPGVSQVQLVQEDRNSLLIRVVPGPEFSHASTDHLLAISREFLGDSIDISFEQVQDSIPVTSSGKYRLTISNVDPLS